MPRKVATKPAGSVTHITVENQAPQNSEPEATKPERPDFWTYMASLSPENWKEHIVYLTRERPKTSINGVGGYLAKIVEPFDIEDIKTAYGGQEFSYIMKRKNEIMYSGRFIVEAPAKFDSMREQAAPFAPPAATNGTEAQNFGKELVMILREELARARETGQGGAGNDAALEMITKACDKAMAIVEKRTPEAGNPASMVRELVLAMKEIGGMNGQQQGSTLGSLVKEVTSLVSLVSPLIDKFFKPADPTAQLGQLKTMMEFADMLRGGGGGGGSRGTTTNDLIAKGIETLPTIIEQMAAGRSMQRASVQRTAPPAAPPGTAAPVHARPPQYVAPAAPAIAGPSAAPRGSAPLRVTPLNPEAPEDAAQPENVGAPTMPAELPQPTPEEFNAWVSARVVELIYLGFDGGDVVDWLLISKPGLVEDLTKYTDEQIEGLFSMDPVLARALQHPNWKRILMEARNAAVESQTDEEEDEEKTLEPAKVN